MSDLNVCDWIILLLLEQGLYSFIYIIIDQLKKNRHQQSRNKNVLFLFYHPT